MAVDSDNPVCPVCASIVDVTVVESNKVRADDLSGSLIGEASDEVTEFSMHADAGQTTAPVDKQKDPSDPSAGRRFGDYEIEREIARGGMGVVFKARQLSLGRPVALKMILASQFASEDEIRRFRVESESAARLTHPGIVPIYEVGEHNGQHFYSMGLVEGGSLTELVKDGPLPPHQAARLMQPIAVAVHYAHARNIVHRDLKPSNVLLDSDGQPKVTDFGLAKNVEGDSGLTATGQILGTPSYMPPEQASGKTEQVGPLADVYSLGAILFFLLTGRPPFQGDSLVDTLRRVVEQDVVSPRQINPGVDLDLATICLKCMRKEPDKRYASAAELADELDLYLSGKPITARPISRSERTWRWCRRNPILAGLLLTVMVSLFGGIGFSLHFAIQADDRLKQSLQNEALALDESRRADREASAAKANEINAKRDRDTANRLRDFSRKELDVAGRKIYLGDMQAAQQAWNDKKIVRMLSILRAYQSTLIQNDHRRWEWYYLNGLCHQEVATLPGHTAVVDHLAWSLDGLRLASASSDSLENTSSIRIWEPDSATNLAELTGYTGRVTALEWSFDSTRLASAHDDGNVIIWDVMESQPIRTLRSSDGVPRSLAWNPDDTRLAIAGESGLVKIWDPFTGELKLSLAGHEQEVQRLAWNNSGNRLASSAAFGTVRIWDPTSTEPVRVIEPQLGWLDNAWAPAFAWHPDGEHIAVESSPNSVTVFDLVRNDRAQIVCTGHTAGTKTLEFNSDGRLLAAFGESNVHVWNSSSGNTPLFNRPGNFGAWLEGAKLVVARSGHSPPLQVHDIDSDQVLADVADRIGSIDALDAAPDRQLYATAGDDGKVRIWSAEPEKNQSRRIVKVDGTPSPNGSRIARHDPATRSVLIADAESGNIQETFSTATPVGLLWSPDGQFLLIYPNNMSQPIGKLMIWQAGSARDIRTIETATGFSDFVFSPDCRLVAGRRSQAQQQNGRSIVLPDRVVDVFDIASGEQIHSLGFPDRSDGQVTALAWKPDSSELATAHTVNGRPPAWLRIWDMKTGSNSRGKDLSTETHALAWSSDGSQLAIGSSEYRSDKDFVPSPLMIWNLATDSVRSTLADDGPPIQLLAWSPDESRLLSADVPLSQAGQTADDQAGSAVRLWDTETLSPIMSFPAKPGISSIEWDADGEAFHWRTADSVDVRSARSGYRNAIASVSSTATYEKQFTKRSPAVHASELANRIFIRQESDWTILKPDLMSSSNGSTLSLQEDGSILVSGTNPDRDSYELVCRELPGQIAAIRLETLPHPSLPLHGSGRAPTNGNFALSEWQVAIESRDRVEALRLVRWKHTWSDHQVQSAQHYRNTAMHIGLAIDGNPQTHWECWPRSTYPHWAIFVPDQPIEVTNGNQLRFKLDFQSMTQHSLGHFRLTALAVGIPFTNKTRRPEWAYLTDPWERLAAAYHVSNNQPALDKLLGQFPEAAAGIAEMHVASSEWDQAIAEFQRVIAETHSVNLMVRLARTYQLAGRTVESVPHLAQASAANPDDTILFMRTATLQAWFGEHERFVEACERSLALARTSSDPAVLERVAKICCLEENLDQGRIESVVALARNAVRLGKQSSLLPWYQMALGMAEYRNGNFEQADAALLAASTASNSNIVKGTSTFFLAMSVFRQGKYDEARHLLDSGAAIARPLPNDPNNPLAGNANHDDLILWMAWKEANKLIMSDDRE